MLELSAKLRLKTGRQNKPRTNGGHDAEGIKNLKSPRLVQGKQIRKQGFIPAILYGRKVKNLPLLIEAHDFEKIYQEAGESTLIKLKIEGHSERSEESRKKSTGSFSRPDGLLQDDKSGGDNLSQGDKEKSGTRTRTVLVHDTARDPITSKIIHIDFNQVRLDEVTTVEVPLVFIGKSMAIEQENGVLIKSIPDIEVKALPQDLPSEIEVDISSLKTFDDNIYVKDLKIPDKVELTVNPDDVVASVIPPRTKAALEELEETPVEEVEEVEVEEKGKAKEEVKEEAEKPTKEEGESKPAKSDSDSGGE